MDYLQTIPRLHAYSRVPLSAQDLTISFHDHQPRLEPEVFQEPPYGKSRRDLAERAVEVNLDCRASHRGRSFTGSSSLPGSDDTPLSRQPGPACPKFR